MHYPVKTEKHVADRWQVSLKTLRRYSTCLLYTSDAADE